MESQNYKKIFEEDGCFFEGELVDGIKNGYGCEIRFNGEKYEGQWTNNMREGFGKLTFSNGAVYTGMFKND